MAEVINADLNPNGLIQKPWKTPYILAIQDLTDEEYIVNGAFNFDKYDLVLYQNTWFRLLDFQEGREYKFIFNINSTVVPPLPVYLFFISDDKIMWHGVDEYPKIYTNGKITMYKSNGIIYAEFTKPYTGTGGSDSDFSNEELPCDTIEIDGGDADAELCR